MTLRKHIVVAFVALALVGFGLSQVPVLRAQTAPPAAAAPAPKDELVDAWIDTAKLAAQLANSQCNQLESVKQFNRIQAEVAKKVEARLPGYTVNWSTFSIVKAPATPAAK